MQVLRIILQIYKRLRYPRKVVLVLSLTQSYISEKHTAFGLSDEEKKNTSDNFELHLELGNWRNVALTFFTTKQTRSRLSAKIAKIIL